MHQPTWNQGSKEIESLRAWHMELSHLRSNLGSVAQEVCDFG